MIGILYLIIAELGDRVENQFRYHTAYPWYSNKLICKSKIQALNQEVAKVSFHMST
jgi:hypothetical protein